jgi:hypothetical protein
MKAQQLLLLLELLSAGSIPLGGDDDSFRVGRVHNAHGAAVTEVHVVLSSHFDAGCKTGRCTAAENLLPGEPRLCAAVGAGNRPDPGGGSVDAGMGEPFAFHIVNRYFDEFFPRAIALAEQGRAAGTPYRYMTQPWVAALYLDCANGGITAWPGMPVAPAADDMPLLHCPNATARAAFKAAMVRGDIFMHAFPHDGEASYYPDASLFEAALRVGERVAEQLGIAPPRAVSQRDVPGWTRAALPHLARHNISGLSFGAGTPPGKADVPPVCVWRDEASGAEVVLLYETGYGSEKDVFVLPNGVALTAAWTGDNTGPGTLKSVAGYYTELRKRFPGAEVTASTFEAFFDVANSAAVKPLLPVVTAEIGDGWLYGVPSDPLKNAQFREAARQRAACLASGACDAEDPALVAFDRLLVKVPEHTWGVAQGWFLPDYENYTNAAFDRARDAARFGFVANNTVNADYNSTVNSWVEQRTYVTAAPALLRASHPELAANLSAALAALAHVTDPSADAATMAGYERVHGWTAGGADMVHDCGGGVSVGFDGSGALSTLVTPGAAWASAAQPLGRFLYETYNNSDYNPFLADMASRIGDTGVWPAHTPSTNGCAKPQGHDDSALTCGNFRKPNMTNAASPVQRSIAPTVTQLWQRNQQQQQQQGGGGAAPKCDFLIKASMPEEAAANAGAPRRVVTRVVVTVGSDGATSVVWDVVQLQKRPTRLPEAEFFSFVPAVAADAAGSGKGSAWRLMVLGQSMDPTDVLGSVGATEETSVFGGSPHLRGVEAAIWAGAAGTLTFTSLDVPILCTGKASPFISPRTAAPDMARGVHFNIVQNIWNTNYVLWYPFAEADQNIRSRFRLDISRGQ